MLVVHIVFGYIGPLIMFTIWTIYIVFVYKSNYLVYLSILIHIFIQDIVS